MKPARALYESWLFESTQGALPGWKQALLARALRRDLGLRCLAAELLEFECEPTREDSATDLRARVRERLLAEAQEADRPLFPSSWIPAGAIAALVLTALVALNVHPFRARQNEASVQPVLANPDLPPMAPGGEAQNQAPAKAALVRPVPLGAAKSLPAPTSPAAKALPTTASQPETKQPKETNPE